MDQQCILAEDATGTEGKPFDGSRGRGRNSGIGLQKRQNADMAQQAAVVVRKMRCVIVLERRKLRQGYGAQQKDNEYSPPAGAAAECHLHSAYHSRYSDSLLPGALERMGIDQRGLFQSPTR